MLQLAICDDQIEEMNEVAELLAEYARLHPETPFELRMFQSGHELLECIHTQGGFPFYLLDVMMPEPDGLALGAAIREGDADAVIIYLTSSPDYALDSYGVQASGYLLKPLKREALFAQLDRVLNKLVQEQSQMLTVKTRDCISLIRPCELRYVEGNNHTTVYYLSKERSITAPRRGSFDEAVTPLLEDERFLRVGSSFLVNMLYVERMEPDSLLMREGGKILIPRLKRRDVRKQFMEFVLKRGLNL